MITNVFQCVKEENDICNDERYIVFSEKTHI